jgi:hypothetical protein
VIVAEASAVEGVVDSFNGDASEAVGDAVVMASVE